MMSNYEDIFKVKRYYWETREMDDLKCPNCGGDNVHIDDVVCWTRPTGEDGPVTIVHVGRDGSVGKGPRADLKLKNPSSRRHAFSLRGNCENSGCHFFIHFSQHKGVTNVSGTLEYIKRDMDT